MIELKQGDCLELMKEIPTGSVDMILCDLPYGTTACAWDNIIPFEPLWEQYERVIRANGYIVLFSSQPFTSRLICSNIENYSHSWVWNKGLAANPLLCKKMPLKNYEEINVFCYNYNKYDFRRNYFRQVLDFIGEKKRAIIEKLGQGLDHCFRVDSLQFDIPTESNYKKLIDVYGIDKMLGFVSYEKLAKYLRVYNPQMIKLDKKRKVGGGKLHKSEFMNIDYTTSNKETDETYPTAIIYFSNRKGIGNTFHPTQKPVELLEYLIKTYTNEGDIVLDNCMGSGSTGVACINTNRSFIGIELNEHYFNIAKERIENVSYSATEQLKSKHRYKYDIFGEENETI